MNEQNTALATVRPETAALMAAGGLGLEDTFIRPTNIELIQRTTRRQNVRAGKLFDVLIEAELDELQVVPLAIKRGRALFPDDGGLGAKPICRSDDGVAPSQFAQFPQADLCRNCPKGSWDNYDFKTGKGKPTCKEKWQMLCVLRDSGLPRKIQIGGMSIKPTKNLLEQIKQDILIGKAKGEPMRNLFDYTFRVVPTFVEGKLGSFYVLSYKDVKRIQNPGEFGPVFEQYVLSARAKQAEAEEAKQVSEAVDEAVEGEI